MAHDFHLTQAQAQSGTAGLSSVSGGSSAPSPSPSVRVPRPLTLKTLAPGAAVLGWVAEVAADHLWLLLSPAVRGRVHVLDASSDPQVREGGGGGAGHWSGRWFSQLPPTNQPTYQPTNLSFHPANQPTNQSTKTKTNLNDHLGSLVHCSIPLSILCPPRCVWL